MQNSTGIKYQLRKAQTLWLAFFLLMGLGCGGVEFSNPSRGKKPDPGPEKFELTIETEKSFGQKNPKKVDVEVSQKQDPSILVVSKTYNSPEGTIVIDELPSGQFIIRAIVTGQDDNISTFEGDLSIDEEGSAFYPTFRKVSANSSQPASTNSETTPVTNQPTQDDTVKDGCTSEQIIESNGEGGVVYIDKQECVSKSVTTTGATEASLIGKKPNQWAFETKDIFMNTACRIFKPAATGTNPKSASCSEIPDDFCKVEITETSLVDAFRNRQIDQVYFQPQENGQIFKVIGNDLSATLEDEKGKTVISFNCTLKSGVNLGYFLGFYLPMNSMFYYSNANEVRYMSDALSDELEKSVDSVNFKID